MQIMRYIMLNFCSNLVPYRWIYHHTITVDNHSDSFKVCEYFLFFFLAQHPASICETYVRRFSLKLSRKLISSLVYGFRHLFSRASGVLVLLPRKSYLLLALFFLNLYYLYIYMYIYYNNITYNNTIFAYNKISVFNGRRSPDGLRS